MRGGFIRLTLGVAALLALLGGVARAETPRLVPTGNFAAEGPFGVAVDNSTSESDASRGDVYVGNFLPTVKGKLEFNFSEHNEKFDASNKLLLPFGEPGAYSGVAVNPTNGDVYVLNSGTLEVDTYYPTTGALVATPFTVPPSGNVGLGGGAFLTGVELASDSAGNVYVPVAQSSEECGPPATTCVLEYSPAGEKLKAFTGSGAVKGPTGVTVDSGGNLWVADAGNNRIEELNPTDELVKTIKSEGVTSVALDPRGYVLATVVNETDPCGELLSPCAHLVVYSTAGAQLQDLGAGDFGAPPTKGFEPEGLPSMLAVNESSGRVYVTDDGKGRVWTFDPPRAPQIGSEVAAEVSTSEAKLGAVVDPGGLNTTYRFEYGTSTAYGQTTPFPQGSAGEGLGSRTVWAAAKGLAPGTTYHYRVVATNALGAVEGADRTFTTQTVAEAACPGNEQLRTGFSASLPDCRAYELVTPPNDASAQPDTTQIAEHREGPAAEGGGIRDNQAARDGSRMSFQTEEVLPGAASGGLEFVSTRSAAGWSAEDVVPLQSYTGDRCIGTGDFVAAYSAEVSSTVLSHPFATPGKCGVELVEVVPGEPRGVQNLLLRDNTTGSYQLVDVTPPGVAPEEPTFLGASVDLGHIVFRERAPLVSGAPAGVEDVYEWSGGSVRLVTVLPEGAMVAGELAGISTDGSDVLFTASGNLYARLHGELTLQVDAVQQGGSGASGGGVLQHMSADGSLVFFSDTSRLTADSTASPSQPDSYECEIVEFEAAGKRTPRCNLRDLTAAKLPGGAGLFSEDGSTEYFNSTEVLASNTREYPNAKGETVVEKAQAGENNLYVYRGGSISFIVQNVGGAQVSSNGEFLAITTGKPLTGYDNTDAVTKKLDNEIFLYSAASRQISCVSCKSSGEVPTAGGAFTPRGVPSLNQGAIHYLSDGGRLFFQTAEALLPADTNGRIDVYEYEAGQLHLISTGTSSSDSYLLEASDKGQDVFFLTRQKLLPQDTNEEALSIYDARVNGGFSESVSPPACTTPEACRGASAPQPGIFGVPASQTFSGVGNFKPPAESSVKKHCKKSFVEKKGKCVKKKVKRKSRNARKTDRANHKRGG
ncbi:MAG TPA: hypothetical protein VNY27_08110 [Solirubrobacteraceae bacterium]|nr:hypothetical protein [Solirubrobacteraceae bacterium]